MPLTIAESRIETERLYLRPPTHADFDGWVELMADAEASQYIGGPQTRSEAWRDFLMKAGAWSVQGFGMFSVLEKGSDRWLGRIGPWYPEGWPGTEVGWALRRDAWGAGYASEAARACIDYAFQTLEWTEVVHTIHPDNQASARLAERLGAQCVGPCQLPPPLHNEASRLWKQTRAEWLAREPAGAAR